MNTPTRTEEFEHSVTVEWYEDDIVAFTNNDQLSRGAMDVWAQKVIEETTRSEGKVRHIMDLSHSGAVITPYLRSKVKEINEAYPDVTGYVAVVFKEGLITQAIRLFVNRELTKQQRGMKSHICFSRDEALLWLREQSFD